MAPLLASSAAVKMVDAWITPDPWHVCTLLWGFISEAQRQDWPRTESVAREEHEAIVTRVSLVSESLEEEE